MNDGPIYLMDDERELHGARAYNISVDECIMLVLHTYCGGIL
jgi:hypothetical protein